METLKTIKVLPASVVDLNIISALSGKKQYQVVWDLVSKERNRLETKQAKEILKKHGIK